MLTDFTSQQEQLQNIVDELIILKDGKYYPKPGVTNEQLLYAIKCVKEIDRELKEIRDSRVKVVKKLSKLDKKAAKICERARPTAQAIMDQFGREAVPSWFAKYLGI